jgi:hypothetical protein
MSLHSGAVFFTRVGGSLTSEISELKNNFLRIAFLSPKAFLFVV